MIEEGQIQIHTENIFPIIKKAVYSDHEIFLRELVSNSVDAINKRRMASIAGDCDESPTGKVTIKIDSENKRLIFSDNGIGMTAEEVKRYINQVAFSSAEEFLEKYKQSEEGIIGHFGLGFYSSFMVAKNVELITKSSIGNSQAVKWSCNGSPKFSLEDTSRSEAGTDVILYLLEEEEEYLEPTRIKSLVNKYCDFMQVEVYLEGELANKSNPLWKRSPSDISDKEYIDFYNYLYPFQGEPLLWIHLNTDFPYSLQGILYFPKLTGRADWEKGEIKLYSNQVFVSDSIKEVVPRYLISLKGIIDSPDIPLNVSRSALQTDRRVKSIGNFISKKIADKMKTLKEEKPSFYCELWDSIGPYIKIGAMEDEKFAEQIERSIIFPTKRNKETEQESNEAELVTDNGSTYTSLNKYIEKAKVDNSEKVLYCTDEISQSAALSLWTSQGNEVLMAETVIDAQFIPWLEDRHQNLMFQRVDAELDQNFQEDKKEIIDKDGEKESEVLRDLIKSALGSEKITVQVQSLKGSQAPPAIILLPEQMRRINDIGALMDQRLPGLPDNHVLLVNSAHQLVQGLIKLKSGTVIIDGLESSPTSSLADALAVHMYDMARLSVGGLEPKEIDAFQSRTSTLMTELLQKGL